MRNVVCACVFAASAVACDQDPTAGSTPVDRENPSTSPHPADPLDPETNDPEDPHARVDLDPPFLVSRFAPTQGLAGIWVTVLTAFDSAGCVAAGTCTVTINGLAAEIADDTYNLEIIVPPGASTGPLCVTWGARTECGENFIVLFAPLIYSISPSQTPVGVRDFVLEVSGDGFPEDAQVWLDWERLDTVVQSGQRLTAVVPYRLTTEPGERVITVFSPSSARCGVRSEPTILSVE